MRLAVSLFLLTEKILCSLDTFLAKPLDEKQAIVDQYFNCLADQNCEIGEDDKTPCQNCFKDAFDTTNSTIYEQNKMECYATCTSAFEIASECFEANRFVGMCWLQLEYKIYGEDHSMFQNPEMAQRLELYKALDYTVPAGLSDPLPIYMGPIPLDGFEDWFNSADSETRNQTITEYSACVKQTVGKFYYPKFENNL